MSSFYKNKFFKALEMNRQFGFLTLNKALRVTVLLVVISMCFSYKGAAQRCDFKTGDAVTWSVSGASTGAGVTQTYLLTDTFGVIKYTTNALPITSVVVAQYNAYSVVFDNTQTAPTLTVGTNISAIGGACVKLSSPLLLGVCACGVSVDSVSFATTGQTVGGTNAVKYILTDHSDKILAINATPIFKSLANGIYNAYTLIYDNTAGITGLSVGANISSVTSTCAAWSPASGFVVCICPIGGTTSTTSSPVCTTSNSGIIGLTGQLGNVIKWQTSTDNGITWTDIINTTTTLNFINAANGQQYRAAVNNGGSCIDAYSTATTITTSSSLCSQVCNVPKPSITGN